MIPAQDIALLAAGVFFLNGLLTGVWKYREILASPDARAHPYVDVAHRASLLYSFAALLLAVFAQVSQLPNAVEIVAVVLPLLFFALAIATYMVEGHRKRTDNQLRHPTPAVRGFMTALIVAEVGGFVVLFYGVIRAVTAGW